MENIGIIGYGKVGKSIHDFFSGKYSIEIYDPYMEFKDKQPINNQCNYAIIAVPTPMKEDGSCDTSIVEESIKWIESKHILIKSTIPPGTTNEFREKYNKKICFSPEYVGEGGYHIPYWKGYPHPNDMKKHDFHIFGGPRKETREWVNLFKKVVGADRRYLQTDSKTAELVKYVENTWLATKVTYVNEIYEICKAHDIDYNELRELWLQDGRVNRSHTLVYEDKRGFGGKCLPKDTNALVKACEKKKYSPKFIKNVLENNKRLRK